MSAAAKPYPVSGAKAGVSTSRRPEGFCHD